MQTISFRFFKTSQNYELNELERFLCTKLRNSNSTRKIAFTNGSNLIIWDLLLEKELMRFAHRVPLTYGITLQNGDVVYGAKSEICFFNLKNNTVRSKYRKESVFTIVELVNGNILFEGPNETLLFDPDIFEFVYSTRAKHSPTLFRLRDGRLMTTKRSEAIVWNSSFTERLESFTFGGTNTYYNNLLEIRPGVILGLKMDGHIEICDLNQKNHTAIVWDKTVSCPFFGVLLHDNTIAIAFENGDIQVRNQDGKVLRTLNYAPQAGTDLFLSRFAEIRPHVLVFTSNPKIIYLCLITGKVLREVDLGITSVACFLK
jgi:hypothetical protein